MEQFKITPNLADQRLDVAIASYLHISRNQAQQLFKHGDVTINGNGTKASQLTVEHDEVRIMEEEVAPTELPSSPDLPIVYEDNDIMVVDKPAGLIVHPANENDRQVSVVDFARAHGVVDDDEVRPGIVHRLDKDTSGLLIIAKNPDAKRYMQDQFRNRQVHKTYLALVRGHLDREDASINLPLGRKAGDPTKRVVIPLGKAANTKYRTIQGYSGYSLVEATPLTGRTHQIRVHFSALGHAIAGDRIYGERTMPKGLHRHFLHAAHLEFTAPNGERVVCDSELPSDLKSFLSTLTT
jgi:23S rRNA pseudouridine1911/1915/1917 synthase